MFARFQQPTSRLLPLPLDGQRLTYEPEIPPTQTQIKNINPMFQHTPPLQAPQGYPTPKRRFLPSFLHSPQLHGWIEARRLVIFEVKAGIAVHQRV
jgi:hypothetical protein